MEVYKKCERLVLILILVAASGLFVAFPPDIGMGKGSSPGVKADEYSWQLTNTQIVERGVVTRIPEGAIVHDYSLQAAASALNDSTPIREGLFSLKATLFSPAADMPGQPSGYWYLTGAWSITDQQGDPKVTEIKHNPFKVDGSISARLAFNPATEAGLMEADITIPNALNAGRWTAGRGTFSGNEKLEGSLTVRVDLRRPSTGP